MFILLGMLIDIQWSMFFVITSISLFFIFLLIRLLSIEISFWNEYTFREKLFMTLNAPKGIATAVVIFLLSTYAIPGMALILDYGLAFILYSIILSTLVVKFIGHFITLPGVESVPAVVAASKPSRKKTVKKKVHKKAKKKKKTTKRKFKSPFDSLLK